MSSRNRALATLCSLYLLTALTICSFAQNSPVAISIDVNASRHPISPLIYGISWGSTDILNDLNCPLNRYGGNNASRYNWQLNADNRARDWYFESVPDASATAGERGDTFISNSRAAGADSMLTIPTIGWVAKLGAGRAKLSSFSIAKYGAQTDRDWQWFGDAGNGILQSTSQFVTGNDPHDANVVSDSAFQLGWINHLLQTWGAASAGGLKYYVLDNEPSIWHSTHRDVHPVGATMAEVRDRMADYAGRIRTADPNAVIVGPEEWGWSGYILSGYDQQVGPSYNWTNLPDRTANGNWDYLPWLLDQMRQRSAAAGTRLLDVFSVHYYPQGGEFGNDTSTAMQLRRNRSTRSLWDPNYVDESWIGTTVRLVPRLKSWVNSYYPGTRTGITEYNWGAEGHINGATAQADIFGIFGREGLDMAARWVYPDPATPTFKAMKMYRNYDGQKSAFGDVSVSTTVPNSDNLSSFAAQRTSDGALTVMVISKYLSGSTPISLNISNYTANASAHAWQLTSANTIARLADTTIAGGVLSTTVPAQSITLFVIDGGNSSSANSAVFITTDNATKGNWKSVYGAQGYSIVGNAESIPSYATLVRGNDLQYVWASSTTDVRGLQKSNSSTDRIAAIRYNTPTLTQDLNLTDGQTHQIAYYILDWEPAGRTQRIDVIDATTNAVLDTRNVTNASGGQYFVWTVHGHVQFNFVNTYGGANYSGLFFDASGGQTTPPAAPTGLTANAGNAQIVLNWNASTGATSYNLYRSTTAGGEGTTPYKTLLSGTSYTDTGLTNGTTYFYKMSAVNSAGESGLSGEASATPVASSNTAVFITTDNATKGNWQGVYGAQGYSIVGNAESIPAYATLQRSSDSQYVWASSTNDVRGLQKVNSSTDRVAAVRYNSPVMTQDLNLTDGQTHQIAYYILDWEPAGRTQRIDVIDATTNVVLDSRSVTNASGGQYFVWNVHGHVKFNFVNIYGGAIYSGLFFN